MKKASTSIDDYLAGVGREKRAALERLRAQIRAAAPGAEECISYSMPAFRLDGRILVGFGAGENHCALYPMSGATVKSLAAELQDYDASKGTIRFQPEAPLPASLVRKIVRARIAENRVMAKRTR